VYAAKYGRAELDPNAGKGQRSQVAFLTNQLRRLVCLAGQFRAQEILFQNKRRCALNTTSPKMLLLSEFTRVLRHVILIPFFFDPALILFKDKPFTGTLSMNPCSKLLKKKVGLAAISQKTNLNRAVRNVRKEDWLLVSPIADAPNENVFPHQGKLLCKFYVRRQELSTN